MGTIAAVIMFAVGYLGGAAIDKVTAAIERDMERRAGLKPPIRNV